MELCLSSTTTTRVLNLNPSRPSHNSLRNPLLHFNHTHRPFTFLKLPSPYRQFHLLQRQSPPNPSRFTASASSSVATGNEKDQLPADIEVKETQEPNCSVSFFFFFLVTSLSLMFSQIISGCFSLYNYHCFKFYLVLFNWVFIVFSDELKTLGLSLLFEFYLFKHLQFPSILVVI